MIYRLLIVSCFTLICIGSISAQHINGLTAVATPDSFPSDPYPRLSQTNANWVCLVPYGFSRIGQTDLWYNMDRQWWGERKEGVIENIRLAKKNNLKVFLKPQIYFPGGWPGDLDFKSDEDWQEWEAAYRAYILDYIDIAITYDVEMFCIGTEFKISVQKRPSFWRKLISDIRCLYFGDLTYSANWDSFADISFWEDLDYVGISAYFPLSDEQTPKAKTLVKAWKPIKKKLNDFYKKSGQSILFTEYGYLTVDGCAGKTWELEKSVNQFAINEEAQAISFDILYAELWDEEFWAGGFIWKWFPHGQGHEGYLERDYTPQDKLAEKIIAKWFGKDKK